MHEGTRPEYRGERVPPIFAAHASKERPDVVLVVGAVRYSNCRASTAIDENHADGAPRRRVARGMAGVRHGAAANPRPCPPEHAAVIPLLAGALNWSGMVKVEADLCINGGSNQPQPPTPAATAGAAPRPVAFCCPPRGPACCGGGAAVFCRHATSPAKRVCAVAVLDQLLGGSAAAGRQVKPSLPLARARRPDESAAINEKFCGTTETTQFAQQPWT